MSFFMRVHVEGLTWERAGELVRACAEPDGLGLYHWRRPRFFGRSDPPQLLVREHYEGRAVLAENADWDAPTWSLEPDLVARLVTTLECLCRELPEGFTFVAGWVGDDDREVEVSCAELLELAGRSALNPRTRYAVRPG